MKILGSTLHVRKVQINPEVRIAHDNCLEKSNANYPLTSVDMKLVSIPNKYICNSTIKLCCFSFSVSNLFNSIVAAFKSN
jgi:hypothetical protein